MIPKCGHEALTHTLTHTGIAADGQSRTDWIDDLRVFREKGQKTLQPQRKIPILAAHNPEVVGSSPASATKNRRFHHENGGFPNFWG